MSKIDRLSIPVKKLKPHMGTFSDCRKVVHSDPTDEHLGYYFVGTFDPSDRRFEGRHGYTSMIVKADGAEVETLNSRYTIFNCTNSDEFKPKEDNYGTVAKASR